MAPFAWAWFCFQKEGTVLLRFGGWMLYGEQSCVAPLMQTELSTRWQTLCLGTGSLSPLHLLLLGILDMLFQHSSDDFPWQTTQKVQNRIKRSDSLRRGSEGKGRKAALVTHSSGAVIWLQQWPRMGYWGAQQQNENRILLLHTLHSPDIYSTWIHWAGCPFFCSVYWTWLLELINEKYWEA